MNEIRGLSFGTLKILTTLNNSLQEEKNGNRAMPTISPIFPLVLTFGNFACLNVYNASQSFIMPVLWQVEAMRSLLGFPEWAVGGLFPSVLSMFPPASGTR